MNAHEDAQGTAGRAEQPQVDHPRDKQEVTVTVDGKPREVLEGTYVVSEFKKLVEVDPSKELDEVVHGELKPLDDNQHIHIKGGEVFISHARQGGSS